jgi:hypothetical protein
MKDARAVAAVGKAARQPIRDAKPPLGTVSTTFRETISDLQFVA